MSEMLPIVTQSFNQYAAAVLQSRALVDSRDCIKPSARQIFYCMYTDKYVHEKQTNKTQKSLGSASRLYIHGDASCLGIIMRAGQPFSMRYPLVDVEGSFGNLIESGNWSAPRYTSSRLSEISNYLFEDLNKNTISDWRDNYDTTEKYPAVLPSKGFYNIVNGVYGIGIGVSTSIPPTNLREVNNALIKLLWNPQCDFEEIYCAPDFPTGATILNGDIVKESMKNGKGNSCRLRATTEYNEKERCIIVTQIPYGVYTNTICEQLEGILNSENTHGITRFNDLTGSQPLIKIYLKKNANPEEVLSFLYENTSLQSYYGINFTMLEEGRFPKLYTWREALLSYLSHQFIVYRRGYEFDLNKIENRLHIIEALTKVIEDVENVVKLIKSSTSNDDAKNKLKLTYNFDEMQAKAVLEIKLSRLAHLEIEKLIKERTELNIRANALRIYLANETEFKKQIELDLIKVSNKFGDNRRTQIKNLSINKETDNIIEKRSVVAHLTSADTIQLQEISTLLTQNRGGIGQKIPLSKGCEIIYSIRGEELEGCFVYTNIGKVYQVPFSKDNTINLRDMLKFQRNEHAILISAGQEAKYLYLFTKFGYIKKSLITECYPKGQKGCRIINLSEGDFIISAIVSDENNFLFTTKNGLAAIINCETINPLGKIARGVIGMKLKEDDEIIDVKLITKTTKYLLFVTCGGIIKKIMLTENLNRNRGCIGLSIQKLLEEDYIVSTMALEEDSNISIISNIRTLNCSSTEIPLLTPSAQGVRSKKLNDREKIIKII